MADRNDGDSKIFNASGVQVNPATEDKQDTIIAALGGLSSSNIEGLGDVAVGATEVAIAITGTPTEAIRIQADIGNTGIIFLGKTGVLSDKTNDFVRLWAGDEVILDYNDATVPLYVISDVAAQNINVGVIF